MEQANTNRAARRSAAGLAGLVTLSLILYWAGNARTPLWDRDEPRFAEAAREMLVTGDFIVPRFQGELRPDKPVLGYWFIAAGMKAFGGGEFGARLFSGIFGAMSIVVLYRLARRMTGSDVTALSAAAMLATAPVMFMESKLCTVDAGLLFWLLLSFTGLWRIWQGRGGSRAKALFWAGLALAVLTKGPVALAAVFAPVALLAVFARDRSFLKRMGWAWGIPLFIAITLPWAWAVQAATNGEFLHLAIGRHVIERAGGALEGHSGFPGFYAATLFVTFFPWAFFVPGAIWSAFGGLREKKLELFLVAWAAGLVIVLEFVGTKMVHYSLPAFPALAVLVALFLERHLHHSRLIAVGAWAAFAMGLVLAVGAPLALHLAGMEAAVLPMAGAGVILAGGMLHAAVRRGRWLRGAFAATAAWLFVTGAWGMPIVGWYASTPAVMDAISRVQSETDTAGAPVSIGYREPSLVFYLGGDVEFLDGPADFPREPIREVPRIVVVTEDRTAALEAMEDRVMVEWAVANGFNFANGRWEQILVYLDYGG